MALNNNEKADVTYASVLADGKIHVTVPEGTEGSVVREYETSDGKKGSKTEMLYTELVGMITKVAFYEGNFGNVLQVTAQDGEDKPIILSLSASSNYGEDMMKKLINVDMKRYVKIVPFTFEDEKTKKVKKGITIYQTDGEDKSGRVDNYFFNKETKKNKHGYPEVPETILKLQEAKKKVPTAKWKLYFAECNEFLVEQITKHFKLDEGISDADNALNDM